MPAATTHQMISVDIALTWLPLYTIQVLAYLLLCKTPALTPDGVSSTPCPPAPHSPSRARSAQQAEGRGRGLSKESPGFCCGPLWGVWGGHAREGCHPPLPLAGHARAAVGSGSNSAVSLSVLRLRQLRLVVAPDGSLRILSLFEAACGAPTRRGVSDLARHLANERDERKLVQSELR